ncbi:MAG: PorV/PorQ family protein, partial [Bacteroidales bacterium]|nr:PorV/PorQ family protein [Bacteroidales bacterium]
MRTKIKCATLALLLTAISSAAFAQNELGQSSKNYISTGMPVLLIAPDAVSAAMGDAGVASKPDAYSAHWNNAKFAFVENDMSFSTTYTPWLRKLGVGDMNLLYIGGYKRINSRSAVALSLTYFSLGDIESMNEEGVETGNMHPNEFAVDLSY